MSDKFLKGIAILMMKLENNYMVLYVESSKPGKAGEIPTAILSATKSFSNSLHGILFEGTDPVSVFNELREKRAEYDGSKDKIDQALFSTYDQFLKGYMEAYRYKPAEEEKEEPKEESDDAV
jgi:hypothetical protein